MTKTKQSVIQMTKNKSEFALKMKSDFTIAIIAVSVQRHQGLLVYYMDIFNKNYWNSQTQKQSEMLQWSVNQTHISYGCDFVLTREGRKTRKSHYKLQMQESNEKKHNCLETLQI